MWVYRQRVERNFCKFLHFMRFPARKIFELELLQPYISVDIKAPTVYKIPKFGTNFAGTAALHSSSFCYTYTLSLLLLYTFKKEQKKKLPSTSRKRRAAPETKKTFRVIIH